MLTHAPGRVPAGCVDWRPMGCIWARGPNRLDGRACHWAVRVCAERGSTSAGLLCPGQMRVRLKAAP
eukprot:6783244-Alexandrium_andersonii.AAC.1